MSCNSFGLFGGSGSFMDSICGQKIGERKALGSETMSDDELSVCFVYVEGSEESGLDL